MQRGSWWSCMFALNLESLVLIVSGGDRTSRTVRMCGGVVYGLYIKA